MVNKHPYSSFSKTHILMHFVVKIIVLFSKKIVKFYYDKYQCDVKPC